MLNVILKYHAVVGKHLVYLFSNTVRWTAAIICPLSVLWCHWFICSLNTDKLLCESVQIKQVWEANTAFLKKKTSASKKISGRQADRQTDKRSIWEWMGGLFKANDCHDFSLNSAWSLNVCLSCCGTVTVCCLEWKWRASIFIQCLYEAGIVDWLNACHIDTPVVSPMGSQKHNGIGSGQACVPRSASLCPHALSH